jgi:hypothetical protein
MRRRRFFAAFVAATVLVVLPVLTERSFAQRGGGAQSAGAPARPAPRTPDGKVILGSPPGEKGTWNAVDNRIAIPEKPEEFGDRDAAANFPSGPAAFPKPRMSAVPFQPWARALFIYRTKHEFEPYTRCKPAGGARMVATAYGTDFIDVPEQKRIYITQTGGPHSFRPIYMDGRPHPKDLDPSYYGHSVGRWEGDTLVIDTIGFNERSWIDLRGMPTTEQLHLTERISRPDFNTLRYEITIDDPEAYTAPWTTGMFFRWAPGAEQFEFVCQDGNLAPLLMIGAENVKLDRSSRIAP